MNGNERMCINFSNHTYKKDNPFAVIIKHISYSSISRDFSEFVSRIKYASQYACSLSLWVSLSNHGAHHLLLSFILRRRRTYHFDLLLYRLVSDSRELTQGRDGVRRDR